MILPKMASSVKRKEILSLKSDIELKECAIKAAQEMFAKTLHDGMGAEIKQTLSTPPKLPKESLWSKIKKNLKKILTT